MPVVVGASIVDFAAVADAVVRKQREHVLRTVLPLRELASAAEVDHAPRASLHVFEERPLEFLEGIIFLQLLAVDRRLLLLGDIVSAVDGQLQHFEKTEPARDRAGDGAAWNRQLDAADWRIVPRVLQSDATRVQCVDEAGVVEEERNAAAACHDLGLAVDRKTHHLESGKIIRSDSRLREWFSEEQIETIAQAAEDHRASATTPPRSIYGALVAEADRMIVPETIIRRTVQFGFSHYPELDKEGHWQRTLEHLHEKYAEGGYLHLLIAGSPNEEPLSRLRAIIKDEARLREIFEEVFNEETAS